MSQDGFENETLILEALNQKRFSELNNNFQQVIIEMTENTVFPDTLIKAYKKGGTDKTDLVVEIENKKFNISIKKGTGNSVHQEKVEDFIEFLKDEINISDHLANDIRFFIWTDGTYDGTGKISDRMRASEFKKKYPEIIHNLRQFFHNNKRMLIERFIIKGPKTNFLPDFIYYGTPEKGTIMRSNDILDWLCDDKNESTQATIPVGKLTFQTWNPNISGNPKMENRRGQIQLKWSSVGEDLIQIRKEV